MTITPMWSLSNLTICVRIIDNSALRAELFIFTMSFYDLDWYIEMRYHRTVAQIFAERGEDGFREIERNMLHEAAEFQDIVLSCGGGTPCFFDNMEYMNSLAETVYLKATPEVLAMHLKMGKIERPLIKGKTDEELLQYIKDSLKVREPFYMQAKRPTSRCDQRCGILSR